MPEPQDHSRSGFDPSGAARSDPREEARRFWGEYARSTRSGGQRGDRGPAGEAGNGHGSAAAQSHECLDWCPICRTADVLRASAPPELRDQVQGLQRDALVTLRALLDAYIERSGEGSRERRDPGVEDIPID
jgi:hypothetical protein